MKKKLVELSVAPASPLILAGEIAEGAQKARAYAAASRADNTKRAYESRWRLFEAWCAARAFRPLPAAPEVVVLYLTSLAERRLSVSTIDQSLTAISQAHRLAGEASPREAPMVTEVLAGIRRTLGTRQKPKAPLLKPALRAAAHELAAGPCSLAALRDQALLLVGWSGAFRRSELVALDLQHVTFAPEGLEILLVRSKTDQMGAGRVVPVPRARDPEMCPERVLRAWLGAASITEGPLFRRIDRWGHVGDRLSDHAVAVVAKEAAVAAGLEPAAIAGHSLRRGLVTEAARQGRDEAKIMKITGHKSREMLRRYIAELSRWTEAANEGLLDGP